MYDYVMITRISFLMALTKSACAREDAISEYCAGVSVCVLLRKSVLFSDELSVYRLNFNGMLCQMAKATG